MDSIFGFVGDKYVLLACDDQVGRSVLKIKGKEDKIIPLDDNKALALSGEAGERLQFGDFIQKNVHLQKFKYDKKMTTKETANFMRSEMAQALRRSPFFCQTLLAGFDGDEPSLYWIDYLATCQKVKSGAQGYCGYFLGGLFDAEWKKDMTYEEGKALMKKCFKQLSDRFLMTQNSFKIKIINKDGVKEVTSDFFLDVEK
mmetsp:Transcript_24077/g.21134  ORF Transcript_24077/g.21134 Transcript_24077/m.21134 type:complete len:200 (+) Transcript_24077:50-649(+)